MSQALHTSTTGINAGQAHINVIANNVANMNTTAFKSANMVFETLFSNNLSYGSAATKNGGGTNPQQIGLGVKVGGITRNFTAGQFVQTGRDMDCMISGTGFFVVQDADGKQYFTRDGVFSCDSQGNLVTQSGMKVVGAKGVYSNAGSDTTVKIPTNLRAVESGDPNIGTKTLEELNNASITKGDIKVTAYDNDGNAVDVTLSVPDGKSTVNDLIASFNASLAAAGATARFSAADGTISYSGDIKFIESNSTFLRETGLSDSNKTSYDISVAVTLQDMMNYNDPQTISLKGTSIDENGFIVATYKDGSILTQFVDDYENIQWKYITPEGIQVTGNDVTATGSSLAESNFAIELATMVNEEGLVSINHNLWEWGPDVGEVYYGLAGEMSFGPLETGGYEGSNVDVATELSNMIKAQSMIQMNSRVFNSAHNVMQILSQLGG